MKEFIIDTGSPISLVPQDERIMRFNEIQKKTNGYQDVNKNGINLRGKFRKCRITKQTLADTTDSKKCFTDWPIYPPYSKRKLTEHSDTAHRYGWMT